MVVVTIKYNNITIFESSWNIVNLETRYIIDRYNEINYFKCILIINTQFVQQKYNVALQWILRHNYTFVSLNFNLQNCSFFKPNNNFLTNQLNYLTMDALIFVNFSWIRKRESCRGLIFVETANMSQLKDNWK